MSSLSPPARGCRCCRHSARNLSDMLRASWPSEVFRCVPIRKLARSLRARFGDHLRPIWVRSTAAVKVSEFLRRPMKNSWLPFAGGKLGSALRRWAQRPADLLHPWRHVTKAAGDSRAAGFLRRAVARELYDDLARAFPLGEWETIRYVHRVIPRDTPSL